MRLSDRAMALWRAGLLLCLACLCACLDPDCVVGVAGRPVALPCFLPPPLSSNFSIEWRSGDSPVLRARWEGGGRVEMWSVNFASLAPDAAVTGNFSLELPAVHPKEDGLLYRLVLVSGENGSAPLCTVCLRVAASFSTPQVKKQDAVEGGETTFLCQSSGGFPRPAVSWLINSSEEPPEGAVRTEAAPLPDSQLYNISSHLTVNVSEDATVTCSITNLSTNETVTSASGRNEAPIVSRASEAMWIFSTALCVAVGLMVIAGVAYQIHLDRLHKRRKEEYRQMEGGGKRRRRRQEETEVLNWETKETDV